MTTNPQGLAIRPLDDGVHVSVPHRVLVALLRANGGSIVLNGDDLIYGSKSVISEERRLDPYQIVLRLEERE